MLRKLVLGHVSATDTGKNYDRKIANKSSENVVNLKYLRLTLITFYSRDNEVKDR